MRLISGFGRAGTTDGQGYTEVERDPVVQFSEPVCSHMNDDHADASEWQHHSIIVPPWFAPWAEDDRCVLCDAPHMKMWGGASTGEARS